MKKPKFTKEEIKKAKEYFKTLPDPAPYFETISDGLGNQFSAWCSECKKKTMIIIRPSKAQCTNCE